MIDTDMKIFYEVDYSALTGWDVVRIEISPEGRYGFGTIKNHALVASFNSEQEALDYVKTLCNRYKHMILSLQD